MIYYYLLIYFDSQDFLKYIMKRLYSMISLIMDLLIPQKLHSLRAVYEIEIVTFLVFYVQSYYLYALKSVNIFLYYFIYCF